MASINVTPNHFSLVDSEDSWWLMSYRWCLHNGYAVTNINGKTVYMHRLILGLKGKKPQVDHINNNKLDNQKSNLRLATPSQNRMNIGIKKNNTSGFKGVSWSKTNNLWRARIWIGGKEIFIGYYRDAKRAAQAYNNVAKTLHKEFANLNQL